MTQKKENNIVSFYVNVGYQSRNMNVLWVILLLHCITQGAYARSLRWPQCL